MDATLTRFVRRLLLDDPRAAGLEAPRLARRAHRSLAKRALTRHGLSPATTHPADLAEAEGFKLWRAALPRRCGACLGDNLYIPQGVEPAHEGLIITHERAHGWIMRDGADAVEADAWWVTFDLLCIPPVLDAPPPWVPAWFVELLHTA